MDRDPDSQITDFVTVKEGEDERVLRLAKAEAEDLRPDDEAWILDAWYADGLRPTQFRLTLLRLLLEYPALLLLPAAFGLWRVRKASRWPSRPAATRAAHLHGRLPPAGPALRQTSGGQEGIRHG